MSLIAKANDTSKDGSNIRNPQNYIENLWDWSILNSAFPDRIRPGGVDGIVERRGHFLIIEAKQENAEMPDGQWYTYKRLLDEKNKTLIIVYGQRDVPVKMRVFREDGSDSGIFPANLNRLIEECRNWYQFADSHPLPLKIKNYQECGACLSVSAAVLINPKNGNTFLASGVQIYDGKQYYRASGLILPVNAKPYTRGSV